MAAMTVPQRAALTADLMRAMSADRDLCPSSKADLLAAVDAADLWASNNAGSYNTALPLGFRTAASAALKSRLLEAVIITRRKVGA